MHVTKPYEFAGFGVMHVTKPYEFIGFGVMHVTKPYEFIGFGAMFPPPRERGGRGVETEKHSGRGPPGSTSTRSGHKPSKFIGFGSIHGPKPYKFIGFGDIHGPKPHKFIGFGSIHGPLFFDLL
jgi:hypothetical protein